MSWLAEYNPVYPKDAGMALKMALQAPKFLAAISKEHKQVEKIVAQNKVDVIIFRQPIRLLS